jgi:hypothetical protein
MHISTTHNLKSIYVAYFHFLMKYRIISRSKLCDTNSYRRIYTEEHFQANADVHNVNTTHKHCLYKTIVNLSCFQRTANYAVIKFVDNFQSDLQSLMNEKGCKITLKLYLNTLILLLMNTYCPENYASIWGLCRQVSWQYAVYVSLNCLMCNHCALWGFLCENFYCTVHMFWIYITYSTSYSHSGQLRIQGTQSNEKRCNVHK